MEGQVWAAGRPQVRASSSEEKPDSPHRRHNLRGLSTTRFAIPADSEPNIVEPAAPQPTPLLEQPYRQLADSQRLRLRRVRCLPARYRLLWAEPAADDNTRDSCRPGDRVRGRRLGRRYRGLLRWPGRVQGWNRRRGHTQGHRRLSRNPRNPARNRPDRGPGEVLADSDDRGAHYLVALLRQAYAVSGPE